VGKKSCLCCHWLGELLVGGNGQGFLLPGTHGIVFPWTPPLFGIPEPILEQLEQKLILKLIKVTETWIQSLPVPPSSHQSLPTSSSHDDFYPNLDWIDTYWLNDPS